MSAEYAGMMFDMSVPNLDPKPWMTREVWEGRIRVFRINRKVDPTDVFRPRPEYSQDIEDYQ